VRCWAFRRRRSVRRLRKAQHLTQQGLAKKLKSSQSRIAKIEAGAPDVSLDLMFRGFFEAGGELTDLADLPKLTPDVALNYLEDEYAGPIRAALKREAERTWQRPSHRPSRSSPHG